MRFGPEPDDEKSVKEILKIAGLHWSMTLEWADYLLKKKQKQTGLDIDFK